MARIFTDPTTGKTYEGDPVTGDVREIIKSAPGPGFRQRGAELLEQGKTGLRQGADAAQAFLGRYGKYAVPAVAVIGAAPAIRESLTEINEGRPLGAVAALAPAGLSAIGAGMLGRTGQAMIGKGGVAGSAIGLGLMGLGAILPGAAASGAESVRQEMTGKPTKGKEGELANQLAARGQILNQDLSALDRTYGVHLNYMRDLARDQANQDYLNFQRMVPELEKMKNNELIRQQSLNAHMAQQQAMLGTLATAGALAQGAQAETGANIRTALTSAPYAGSVLQAPQIRFG